MNTKEYQISSIYQPISVFLDDENECYIYLETNHLPRKGDELLLKTDEQIVAIVEKVVFLQEEYHSWRKDVTNILSIELHCRTIERGTRELN